ncbi:lipoprotein NlpE [Candidatus Termititenax dinenymphae]|uniref:Lipoprotein NlpE n=1 Tax=Candidatus Termititenax dinenymphae TaxID=2218523 RepID=A0A388TKG9_9BACT|nr:lipoprotein NlpE [Candidatus Termititenax dinenymphae]
MKKLLVLVMVMVLLFGLSACKKQQASAIDSAHNSQNSLNWDGVYTGVIPAADGPGIDVKLTLGLDYKYTLTYKYLEKTGTFNHSGTFVWSSDGSNITLDTDQVPNHYKVGENILWQLDLQGNRITGSLADKYTLQKVQ